MKLLVHVRLSNGRTAHRVVEAPPEILETRNPFILLEDTSERLVSVEPWRPSEPVYPRSYGKTSAFIKTH